MMIKRVYFGYVSNALLCGHTTTDGDMTTVIGFEITPKRWILPL